MTKQRASRVPPLPFVKVAGQEELKLALLLNVVDPGIGGVLVMGDRGTGKSIAVSLSGRLLNTVAVAAEVRPVWHCSTASTILC